MEVQRILKRLGPSLGSDLAKEISTDQGLKPPAARKRIERAKKAGQICSLDNLRFKHNEQFLYLPEDADTEQFRAGLAAAFSKAESPLADCLSAIRARGGLIPKDMFPTVSGLPFDGQPRLSALTAREILLENKLITETSTSLGATLALHPELCPKPIPAHRLRARAKVEQIFLAAILDWFRLQGFVTAHKASLRNDIAPPQFGFFAWDLVSPSYLFPLTSYRHSDGTVKPGFVVLDVCLGSTLEIEHVQYFINKCVSLGARYYRPFIPLLVGNWFSKEALDAGRKNGLMFTTPKNLFGKAFAEMLDALLNMLDEQSASMDKQAEEIANLLKQLDSLSHLEGVMGNVLADTFELIVGHCIQSRGGKVTFGRKFIDPSSKKPYDTDVLLLEPERAVHGIECKKRNKNSLVKKSEVEYWFNTVVPVVRQELMRDRWFKDVAFEFAIWTSSDFDGEALNELKSIQDATKETKYKISWKNGKDILDVLSETRDSKLKDAFRNYFLKS